MNRPGPAGRRQPGVPPDEQGHRGVRAETRDTELTTRGHDLAARCAMALLAHAADRSAPLAEFGCGAGLGGVALARVGFGCIDGFDPSEQLLRAAAQTRVYRRLDRADLSRLDGVPPDRYANAAAIDVLDAARYSPEVLDAVLAILPGGGCFVFSLPGSGASVGRFRTRVLELCEHFVAEPVFRTHGIYQPVHGLQSTVYVLKKR